METITIYCDGLVEPINPGGYGCWGWIALADGPQPELGRDYGCIGRANSMSNNVVEYQAVLRGLRRAVRQGWGHTADQKIIVRTDSQLVVRQILGQWACQAAHLQPLRDEARQLLEEVGGRLEWVSREDNRLADGLTRLAYAQALRQAGIDAHTRAEMLRVRKTHQQRRMPLKTSSLQNLPFLPRPWTGEPDPSKDQQLQLPLF